MWNWWSNYDINFFISFPYLLICWIRFLLLSFVFLLNAESAILIKRCDPVHKYLLINDQLLDTPHQLSSDVEEQQVSFTKMKNILLLLICLICLCLVNCKAISESCTQRSSSLVFKSCIQVFSVQEPCWFPMSCKSSDYPCLGMCPESESIMTFPCPAKY